MILLDDFYELKDLKQEDNKIICKVLLNKNHRIFDGHFPDNPVVPGVCMMEMVKEVLQIAKEKEFRLLEGTNAKFMNILNPEVNPVVVVEHEILDVTSGEIKLRSLIKDGEKVFLKFSGKFTSDLI